MIDGHIHYIEYMGADRLNQIVEEYHYDGIALQCIPDSAGREVLGDAFRYREQCPMPVYIFGGIRRELYRLPEDELKTALVSEARNLMTKGCTGIKMLEGKPIIASILLFSMRFFLISPSSPPLKSTPCGSTIFMIPSGFR